MVQRRIRWPLIMTILLLAAGMALLTARPQMLSSAATQLINRQLQAHGNVQFRVGAYQVRLFEGLDLLDVTLTRRSESGALSTIAVDTLEVDFRLRDVLGRSVSLRRLAARGLQLFHHEGYIEEDDAGFAMPSLPPLAIEHIDVRGAQMTVSRKDGRLREHIDELNWRGELSYADGSLLLSVRSGSLSWATRNTRLDRLYGAAMVNSCGIHVTGLHAAWNRGQASVSGSLGPTGLELIASGRNLSAEEVNDLVGLDLGFMAHGDIECTVTARQDTVFFRGTFNGQLADWDLREVEGEAIIAHGMADFSAISGGVGGAWFEGSLQVDERSDPTQSIITMSGQAHGLDLRAGLIPMAPDLPKTGGAGHLQIIHTSGDDATRVRGLLTAGFIEFMPFDTCQVDVWARGDSLHFHSVDLRLGGIKATLTGSSDRHDIFHGELRLLAADLGELPSDWGWPHLRGRCEGQAILRGPLDELGLSGKISFEDLGHGPVNALTAEVDLEGKRLLGEDWTLNATATGEGFKVGGVLLGRYWSRLQAESGAVALESFRTTHGDTILSMAVHADLQPARAHVRLDHLHLGLADKDWHTAGPAAMVLGPGFLQLPHLSLVSSQGELSVSVDYQEAAEVLDGRLVLHNINLDVLDTFVDWPQRTGGQVTARLEVSGRPAEPILGLQGELREAVFPLARIDSLFVMGSFLGGTVHLDTLALASDQGRVVMRGTVAHPGAQVKSFWPGASMDVLLEIQNGDWAFLQQFEIPALESLAGCFDGLLHIGGTTDDPLVTGELESAPFAFHWLQLERLTAIVRADATQLALGNLRGRHTTLEVGGRLEIPLCFDLLSEPQVPEDGPFYGFLHVPPGTDLGPLMHATQAFTRVSGTAEAELTISGPMSQPRYMGSLAMDDLEVILRDTEEVYRNGRIRGIFFDNKLILDEIKGKSGLRGTFEGKGTVTFDGLELKTWDIDFSVDRFLVASIPDLRVLVYTDNGRLKGEAVGPDRKLVPLFSGDFELIRGRYTGSFTGANNGADPTLGTIAPDWLADLRIIGAPRTMRIMNRTMELDLSGDVSVVRDADGMILTGSMDIDSGRLPVFNNTFKVVRGSLDFSRGVGVVPVVDIDAETRVRLPSQATDYSVVERLTVHATGSADAMNISYSSESGYPREAIERMLLGLSPFPHEQGDQTAFISASFGAGLNYFEREITSEIARGIGIFDTLEIDQIQRQQLGATGLDPLIGVSKYLGTDLYIKYARGLNQNESDLIIEFQITDHLLLQTERRRRIDEYQGDATYSLDLKYRFEY